MHLKIDYASCRGKPIASASYLSLFGIDYFYTRPEPHSCLHVIELQCEVRRKSYLNRAVENDVQLQHKRKN
jgi:hypothetical protein